MALNSIKTQVAIFSAMVVVLGANSHCLAQATDPTLVDTPSQRWLPHPKSYPKQQENQAKLLSLLRDSLMRRDSAKPSNPSRLSDSEVQSLKDAMKQFENYFPEGLTADSLDAIPPELISKALSNPELVKQAKELAEKYSKENQQKKSNEQASKDEEASADTKPDKKAVPPNSQSPRKNQSPSDQTKQISEEPNKSIGASIPEVDPKGKDFADLMNKLRKTQQTYEQNQLQSNNETGQPQSASAKERSSRGVAPSPDLNTPFPTANNPELPSRSRTEPPPTNPSQTNRKGQQEPPTLQQPGATSIPNANNSPSSGSRRNNNPKQSANPSNAMPSDSPPTNPQRSDPNSSQRKTENKLPTGSRESSLPNDSDSVNSLENELRKQFGDGRLGNSQGTANQRSENPPLFSPSNERGGQNTNPFNRDGVGSNPPKTGSQSNSSLDIRSELDRRGFGPTMQKIIEEAQRASQADRPKTMPSRQSESTPSIEAKSMEAKSGSEGNRESNSNVATNTRTKLPSSNFPKPNESSPRPPRADSPVSKNLQKTGDYLNKLWTDATKNSTVSLKPSTPRSSSSSNSSSTPFSRPEIPSIPNPFSVQVLQGLILLAVACVVACVILKIRFQKEQERKEALAAQMAPKIDEIQTRDDVVRAFHALAKQRLQAAQAWWTCGHVAERFQETLPEHAQPIRTLSGLYEQARYYPAEHKLSEDQIQSAKLALKQCEV